MWELWEVDSCDDERDTQSQSLPQPSASGASCQSALPGVAEFGSGPLAWTEKLKAAFSDAYPKIKDFEFTLATACSGSGVQGLPQKGPSQTPVAGLSSLSIVALSVALIPESLLRTNKKKNLLLSPVCVLHHCSRLREDFGLTFNEVMSIDPKRIAKQYAFSHAPPRHHFNFLAQVLGVPPGAECHCEVHGHSCCTPAKGSVQMMVAGPPCSPFSSQRTDRFASKGSANS